MRVLRILLPILLCSLPRFCSAFTIELDFSYDQANGDFFGQTPMARAAVQAAAADLGAVLTTKLTPLDTRQVFKAKNGDTTVSFIFGLTFLNPSTGAGVPAQGEAPKIIILPADTMRVYVGMRKLNAASGEVGFGGAGGAFTAVSVSGFASSAVAQLPGAVSAALSPLQAVMTRGVAPAIGSLSATVGLASASASYATQYGPTLGNIWFDLDGDNDGKADPPEKLATFWHYDPSQPVVAGKIDFYSVALHELIHSLGLGDAEAWMGNVSGTTWKGPRIRALYGASGANVIHSDGFHAASGLMSTRFSDGTPQEAAMDPSLQSGTRKVLTLADAAFLADMGYLVGQPPEILSQSAELTSSDSATVHATVALNKTPITALFEYGTDMAYGSSVNASVFAAQSLGTMPLSVTIPKLAAGTRYHCRLKVTNYGGTTYGPDFTFQTATVPLAARLLSDGLPIVFSPLTLKGGLGSAGPGVELFLAGDVALQKVGAVTQGAYGSVLFIGSNISYTPGPGYYGEDRFTFRLDPTQFGSTIVSQVFSVTVHSSGLPKPASVAIKGVSLLPPQTGVFSSFIVPETGGFAANFIVGGVTVRGLFGPTGALAFKVGDPLAAVGNATIAKLGDPSGNAVLLTLKLAPPAVSTANDTLLLAGRQSGELVVAAREGDPVENLSGVRLKSIGAFDANGSAIFFMATLSGTGVTTANDTALCAALGGGIVRVLVRENQQVGSRFVSLIGTLVGSAGSLGDGRWRVDGTTLGVRLSFKDKSQGVYFIPAIDPLDWIELATTNLTNGLDLAGATLSLPGFGPEGAAFVAKLKIGLHQVTAANDSALYFGDRQTRSPLFAESGPVPGPDGLPLSALRFKTFADPVVGFHGRLAFSGTISGLGVSAANSAGIWFGSPDGGFKLLARAGDPAPGGGKFGAFKSLAMADNATGGPIFLATLAVDSSLAISTKNNLGLWAVDSTGTLVRLARITDKFAVPVGGPVRELSGLSALVPASGSPGAASGYDSQGHVAVVSTFLDGTSALLRLAIP